MDFDTQFRSVQVHQVFRRHCMGNFTTIRSTSELCDNMYWQFKLVLEFHRAVFPWFVSSYPYHPVTSGLSRWKQKLPYCFYNEMKICHAFSTTQKYLNDFPLKYHPTLWEPLADRLLHLEPKAGQVLYTWESLLFVDNKPTHTQT